MTPRQVKGRDPWLCRAEQNGKECTRRVEKFGDICCAGHWRMVPRDLRQLLIKKQTMRLSKAKRDDCMAAAGLVLAYIETCLIELPGMVPT